MRVFLAVEVGDEVRGEIGRLGKALKRRFPFLKIVPPDNLHITLRFLGELDDRVVGRIGESLKDEFIGSKFHLRLGKVGGFPTRFGARVIWVGLEDDRRLKSLSERIDTLLSDPSIPPRDRPFVAHITVARSRKPVNLEGFSVSPVSFEVKRVVLFQSILAKPNAIYEPLYYYYLADT